MNHKDELREQCEKFHRKHPEVWDMFTRFTIERISLGFKHYSADAIFHRIRWEMSKPEYESGKEFKLCNNHTAFYGRRFMNVYPEYKGFFRTREQTSERKPPNGRPPMGPDDLYNDC